MFKTRITIIANSKGILSNEPDPTQPMDDDDPARVAMSNSCIYFDSFLVCQTIVQSSTYEQHAEASFVKPMFTQHACGKV